MVDRVRLLIKTLVIIFFLLFFQFCFRAVNRLLEIRSIHGIDQMRYFYDQPFNSVDVLLLGSSHVHVSINTATLWEEYGMTAYDLSGAEQPLWMTYYVLRDALKTQNPEVVVLECYSPSVFKDDYHPDWIAENVLGMRFSLNKLRMMAVSMKPEQWEEFFPGFAGWHGRYGQLGAEDWAAFWSTARDRRVFKGFTPYFSVEPQERNTGFDVTKGGLTYKSQVYLTKIMDLCEERELPLFLIVSPYVVRSDLAAASQKEMEDIADEREIPFINYNTDEAVERIGLDYTVDLVDFSHLNYNGSVKFAHCLGSDILEHFEVPDHRPDKNTKRYESWERHAQDIHAQARENGFE